MATVREGLGATAVNGKLYAIGGYNTSYLNTVEEYDPIINTWTTKANMPTARKFLGVTAINGKVYTVGGLYGNYLSTVEEYDIESNTWSAQANMLTARYCSETVSYNGKIFAIGGNNGTYVNKIEAYLMNLPENLPAIPTDLVGTGTATSITVLWSKTIDATSYEIEADGVIISNGASTSYIHSGLNANTQHTYRVRAKNIAGTSDWSSVLIQNTADPSNQILGQWVTKANMSGARYNLASVEANGKIYAVGGYYTSRLNKVEEYDLTTNTWTTKANMPTARDGLGAASCNGKVYAIGGYYTSYLNRVEEYNSSTNTWTIKANMPTARSELGVVELNRKIYAIGGYNGNYLNTVEEYDPTTNTWTTKANMPTARRYPGVAAVNGKIYVIGGYNGSYLNIIEEYDPETNSWTTKGALPIARRSMGVASVLNRIYVIGGYSASGTLNSVEEYDLETNMCTTHLSMLTARYSFGTGVINGKIFAIGGQPNTYKVEALELTIPDPPITPTNIVVNASDISISINWDSVAGAASYDIEVDGIVVNTGSNATYIHNGLIPGTQHNYRVRAKNPSGSSNWSTIITQSTLLIGLKGEYFDNIDFTNSKIIKTDNTINFDWGQNSPEPSIEPDTFSIRWKGQIEPRYSEIYNFYTFTDGGIRLWIDGKLVIGNWVDQGPTENRGTINLLAGQKYDIKIEYFENSNNAIAKLLWSSASQPKEIIPENQLSPTYSGIYEYDVWSNKTNLPISRYDLGAAIVNNKIYAIGGHYSTKVEEYDFLTNSWMTKADSPISTTGSAVAELNGKIYVIGEESGSYLNSVNEYDPQTNTWTAKANMITARSRLCAIGLNGKIYAFGGYNGTYLKKVEEYDPITDTWIQKADMPTGRDGADAVVYNGKIFVIGGADGYGYKNNVEEFNPVSNTWITKMSMPTPRRYVRVEYVNGRIYAIDGSNYDANQNVQCLNTVEVYDPAQDKWITGTSAPTSRWFFDTVSTNGNIYVIGGADRGLNPISAIEEYRVPIILPDAPSIPENIKVSATNTSITVTWNAVADVTGYEIEVDGEVIDNNTQTTYVHNALITGSEHTYRIRSKNIGGSGAWSTVLTKLAIIDPPTNIAAVPKSKKITLTWDTVAGADVYDIEVDGVIIDNGASTNYIHNGLLPNTQHIYRIRSKDAVGAGNWSDPITKYTLLGAPANINITSTGTTATITWNAVNGAEGYDIEIDGTVLDNGLNTSYIHSGLLQGTQHKYRVRAKNINGVGDWSADANIYTVVCTLDKHFSVVVAASNITDFTPYSFTVTYNTNELDVVDLYGSTPQIDMTTGNISGTDVTITQFTPGVVTFTKNKQITPDKSWTGILNIVKFKSKIPNGSSTVNYVVNR